MSNLKFDAETGEQLIRDVRPLTITYHGYKKTFDMPGWYPMGEGEGTFVGDDLLVYDKAIKELKTEAEHLLIPEEIREIRQKLNLTQAQAGNILGGGKTAFQKYESGKTLPSRAISNLLRVLSAQPELMRVLPKFG